MTIYNKLSIYWKVTKPRLWILLVYTGISGYLIASGGHVNIQLFLILLTSLITGTAGANVITSYIDRDIDAIMIRTKHRPIPSGKIRPNIALLFGISLALTGIVTSTLINLYTLLFMLFGLFDNIIVYSLIFKRKNPLNIILGSFSGGAPVIIGYTAYTNSIDYLALVLAALIVVWTPVHIWSLALYYRDDYRRAGVPMLPVVMNEKASIRCIASTAILLILFSYLIPYLQPRFINVIYILPTSILNMFLGFISLKLFISPEMKWSWRLFKLTSPYLGIIFTIMIILSL